MLAGSQMPSRTIAVIGGGISGLAAGYVLSRSDRVTLFEADAALAATRTRISWDCPAPRFPWTPGSSSSTSGPIRC